MTGPAENRFRPEGAAEDPDIHRRVLENLGDGVLMIGQGGRIETLNPAAERILGLEAGEAAGQTFAEVFLVREGFDDFTQVLIDATTTGTGTAQRVVEIGAGEGARSLSVATTYLLQPGGGHRATAAIVVFSDITELRELRETELRMAKKAEEQHGRLQEAYREIESRNEALASALRKVRLVQGLGMVLAIGIFLGAGYYVWQPQDLFGIRGAAVEETSGPAAEAGRRLKMRQKPVSSSISMKGTLAPWRTVDVQIPVDGEVASIRFRVGQEVTEGDVLLTMDLSRALSQLRKRNLDHERARNMLEELENWERSAEMVAARRSFTKAELAMEGSRTSINKSRFLFEEGLIPASEHEDAERQHRGQLLDFEAAKEELATARAKGGAEAVEEARLHLESVEKELKRSMEQLGALEVDIGQAGRWGLGEEIRDAELKAPISGVVMVPPRGRELVEGRPVRGGDTLLTIGDFARLAAVVQVDETDIARIGVDQEVRVTGNAFRGITLNGRVSHVASQADPKSRGIPKFDVTVTLDPVGPEEAERLRAGMSATIRIVTYSNPEALLVPISAVQSRGGRHRLRVVDPATGEVEEREVEIGPTTRNSVEVRAGLEPGETVLVPEG